MTLASQSSASSSVRLIAPLREWLVILLIALLPFHALLVTVATKVIAGRGHAPLSSLALWKEGVLGIIIFLALIEVFVLGKRHWRIDKLDVLILVFALLALIVSFAKGTPKGLILLGFKYDVFPLLVFLLLRKAEWSVSFRSLLPRLLVTVGIIVAILGIVSFFLPVPFFRWLGYSELHSLYVPSGPLAPFQEIAGTFLRRIQGPMSGPNQLGLWLLIPLAAFLASMVRLQRASAIKEMLESHRGILRFVGFVILLIALLLTFSRAAWIGAAIMVGFIIVTFAPLQLRRRLIIRGGIALVSAGIILSIIFPSIIFRLSSSRGHLVRPLEAAALMIRNPLGLGLSSAGPASNRVSEPCVFLRPQDDPSWAKSQPQLCVFLGKTQVQPTDHACKCPFLPENWFLQIGVETGMLGFFIFIALTIILFHMLTRRLQQVDALDRRLVFTSLSLFLAISIGALFLHAWEDAAVAYTAWIVLAVALRQPETEGEKSSS